MAGTRKLLWISLIFILGAAGCGNLVNATPTESPEMIYTRVAETIQANMAQTALTMPTATITATLPLPPTANATNPPLPTISIQTTGTGIALPTIAVVNTQVTVPTTKASNLPGDHAVYLYNRPIDGFSIKYDTEFPIVFALENTGTTTWNTKYTWRFYYGTKCWDILSVDLPSEVKPGQRIEIFVDCFSPERPGDYYNQWALYTDGGVYVQGSTGYLFFTSTP